MNMDNIIFYAAAALIAVLVLTLITNIIVAVTKQAVAWGKIPTQAWVFLVSMVLTFAAAGAAAGYFHVAMIWYYWVAVAVLGFMVCYAAMYGYDNLYSQIKDTIAKAREIIAGSKSDKGKEA